MIGRIRGALLAAVVAFFGLATGAPEAKADFIYDLSVTGGFTGSGAIAFNALSGGSPAGVTAFEFHVSSGDGSPQDYGLGDVWLIGWNIDASSLDLVSFLLATLPIPFESASSALILTLGVEYNVTGCGAFSSAESASLDCGSETHSSGTLRAIAIPEPATLALFGAGLIGLVMLVRRRKAY